MLTDSIKQALPSPEGKRGDLVDWREDAACAPFSYNPDDDPFYPKSEANEAHTVGMLICARCPVVEACWDHAQRTESLVNVYGIRAGMTSAERKSVYRRLKRDRAKAKAQDEAALAAAEDEPNEVAA